MILKKNLKDLLNKYDKTEIISIDEMASHIGEINNYSWSQKNKQCFTIVKKIKGVRYSICDAMSNKKLLHYKIIKGGFNGKLFNDFIKELMLLVDKNKICLFMDNVVIHKTKILNEYIIVGNY